MVPIWPDEGLHLGPFAWMPDGSGVLFAYGERENAPTSGAENWVTSGYMARLSRPLGFPCYIPEPPPGLFAYTIPASQS
jgi:hypothetical protein